MPWRRLSAWWHRDEGDAEFDEEIRHHLQLEVARRMSMGLSRDEAEHQARKAFGPTSMIRESHRDVRGFRWFDDLVADTRYAIRGLLHRPGFAVVAVATLALGIGANTAIYSAVDAILLRSLPYPHPERLMDIVLTGPQGNAPWSWPKFQVFRERQRSYSAVALHSNDLATFGRSDPERGAVEWVTAPFLHTLGVPVATGHDFADEQDRGPNAPRRALISDALWQRRFHADPEILGRILTVDGDAWQIIGVLPPGFRGLSGTADALLPIAARDSTSLAGAWSLEFSLIGRLKPGVTQQQAGVEARSVGLRVYDAYPFGAGTLTTGSSQRWDARARPLDTIRAAPLLRRSLVILFGAALVLLLIACVNLASLLMGRAVVRRTEIAVRLALGAGRSRLIRLLLTESAFLALVGGLVSIPVAWIAIHLLRRLNPADTLRAQGLATGLGATQFSAMDLDLRGLLFTFGVAATVGICFGLVPAFHASRTSLHDALKSGGQAGRMSRAGHTTRRILVVAEVALAMVMLAGSGLLVRSLGRLMTVDPGFEYRQLLTMRLAITPGTLAVDSMPGFYRAAEDALRAVPGVTHVGVADCPPLNGGCNGTIMTFPDRSQSITGNAMVGVHWVSPGWFATMRVPLVQGRMFADADRQGAMRVVLINQTAAHRYFAGQNPIGQRVKVYQGGFDQGATVIGVVKDVRFTTMDSAAIPDVFISTGQAHVSNLIFFVRTRGDPLAVATSARHALQALAPADPVYDMRTMASRVGAATEQSRFSATTLTIFAILALALAVIGIYGVTAFGVAARRHEIGVRLALGAGRERVLSMIVREGVMLAAIGIVIGAMGAVAASRLMRALLFEVSPSDPLTWIAMVAVVGIAALLASWIPARRAAAIDSTEALRD